MKKGNTESKSDDDGVQDESGEAESEEASRKVL